MIQESEIYRRVRTERAALNSSMSTEQKETVTVCCTDVVLVKSRYNNTERRMCRVSRKVKCSRM